MGFAAKWMKKSSSLKPDLNILNILKIPAGTNSEDIENIEKEGRDGTRSEIETEVWSCGICGSTRYWVNLGGVAVCANCHPPVSRKFEIIDAGNTQTSD